MLLVSWNSSTRIAPKRRGSAPASSGRSRHSSCAQQQLGEKSTLTWRAGRPPSYAVDRDHLALVGITAVVEVFGAQASSFCLLMNHCAWRGGHLLSSGSFRG